MRLDYAAQHFIYQPLRSFFEILLFFAFMNWVIYIPAVLFAANAALLYVIQYYPTTVHKWIEKEITLANEEAIASNDNIEMDEDNEEDETVRISVDGVLKSII